MVRSPAQLRTNARRKKSVKARTSIMVNEKGTDTGTYRDALRTPGLEHGAASVALLY
jgi:hypothetical protein